MCMPYCPVTDPVKIPVCKRGCLQSSQQQQPLLVAPTLCKSDLCSEQGNLMLSGSSWLHSPSHAPCHRSATKAVWQASQSLPHAGVDPPDRIVSEWQSNLVYEPDRSCRVLNQTPVQAHSSAGSRPVPLAMVGYCRSQTTGGGAQAGGGGFTVDSKGAGGATVDSYV